MMLNFTTKSSNLQEHLIQITEGLDCDELLVLSGYVSPGPLKNLSLVEGVKLNVIFGLAVESVSKLLHDELLRINDGNRKIKIFYCSTPSHVKIYLWLKNGKPVYCLNGSANFTSNGLLKPYREVLAQVPFTQFKSVLEYVQIIQNSTFPIGEFEPKVKISRMIAAEEEAVYETDVYKTGSLYAERSKINWGHGNAHTNARDAYIPISTRDIKRAPHLFPPKTENKGLGYADNDPIDIIWDDGTVMTCILEGTQIIDGERYPNKIASYKDKKILGDYLRSRMNIAKGEFVTELDFVAYGRDYISLKKIGDATYQFDFKSPSTAQP
jgi:hypothetical protein